MKSKKENPFIKHIRKKRRQQFWKMSHIRLTMFFVMLAICLLAVSFFLRYCYPWLSPFLQALSVGIATGLVVYILGNVRGRNEKYFTTISRQLEELYGYYSKIFRELAPSELTTVFSQNSQARHSSNEYLYDACEAAQKYVEALKKLDFYLLERLMAETNTDVIQMEKDISSIREQTHDIKGYIAGQQLIWELIRVIQHSADWLEEEHQKVEIQVSQIKKYPL